jgi:LPXTG-site transpeptidase (sortase) family protein
MKKTLTQKRSRSLAATAAGLCGLVVILLSLQLQWASPTSAFSSIPGAIITKIDEFRSPKIHAAEPVRLTIPSVNIAADIEKVGLTTAGEMDVPKNWDDAGWFAPGTRPGETGNAVIAGHLDSKTGTAAFWNLKKISIGDEVLVEDANGVTYHFQVKKIENYEEDSAPLKEIFGKTNGTHLNLITCGGKWNKKLGKYEERVVVYTEMMGN